jgi:hypothetical protein
VSSKHFTDSSFSSACADCAGVRKSNDGVVMGVWNLPRHGRAKLAPPPNMGVEGCLIGHRPCSLAALLDVSRIAHDTRFAGHRPCSVCHGAASSPHLQPFHRPPVREHAVVEGPKLPRPMRLPSAKPPVALASYKKSQLCTPQKQRHSASPVDSALAFCLRERSAPAQLQHKRLRLWPLH